MQLDRNPSDSEFQAKTFVDQLVDVILEQALRGNILPGDRLYEQDLSKEFGVSRAPIREALRILEAQGAIESEPYKGMHLAGLSAERVGQINHVRCELEKLALNEALDRNPAMLIAELQSIVDAMLIAADHDKWIDLAHLDARFHGAICAHSGNPFLVKIWSMLRPQLLIIFGISLFEKPPANLAKEHVDLLHIIARGDRTKALKALGDHIILDNAQLDFDAIIAKRRAQKTGGAGEGSLPTRKPRGRPPRNVGLANSSS